MFASIISPRNPRQQKFKHQRVYRKYDNTMCLLPAHFLVIKLIALIYYACVQYNATRCIFYIRVPARRELSPVCHNIHFATKQHNYVSPLKY